MDEESNWISHMYSTSENAGKVTTICDCSSDDTTLKTQYGDVKYLVEKLILAFILSCSE